MGGSPASPYHDEDLSHTQAHTHTIIVTSKRGKKDERGGGVSEWAWAYWGRGWGPPRGGHPHHHHHPPLSNSFWTVPWYNIPQHYYSHHPRPTKPKEKGGRGGRKGGQRQGHRITHERPFPYNQSPLCPISPNFTTHMPTPFSPPR